jgi:protein translocase SecG subunit
MDNNIIPIVQIVISAALIGLVLIQQRGGAGLGSAFGQSGGAYSTQRGIQKKIFRITLALSVVFIGLAIYNLFQK